MVVIKKTHSLFRPAPQPIPLNRKYSGTQIAYLSFAPQGRMIYGIKLYPYKKPLASFQIIFLIFST
jgi:hypothetical protein